MSEGGNSRVVGPVPPGEDVDDYDRRRRRVLWSLPTGLYVVGSQAGGRRNLMTLSWAVQVSTDPKMVAISVERSAVTHQLVEEGGAFALCTLDRQDRAIVRKFVKPASDGGGPDGSALNGFAVRTARTGAPILEQAVAWLDCEVRQALAAGSHTVFLGEVVDAGFNQAEDTAVLRMEDTRMSYGG